MPFDWQPNLYGAVMPSGTYTMPRLNSMSGPANQPQLGGSTTRTSPSPLQTMQNVMGTARTGANLGQKAASYLEPPQTPSVTPLPEAATKWPTAWGPEAT